MRFGKTAWICLLVLTLVVPLTVRAQTPAQSPVLAPAAEVIPETEIRQAIDKYVDRFKAMDLDLFMESYSKQAVENREFPYSDIREAYDRMFKDTNQFLFYLNILGIQSFTNSAFVSGYCEITQTTKSKNEMKLYRGNVQWELVREDGVLRILRLNHSKLLVQEKFWKNL